MSAMGNEIPLQLAQFFRSILLGCTLALLYDLTLALHPLGGKIWGSILDVLMSAGAVSSVFLFVMAEDGELRLFVLFGTIGGAVLFFSLLSHVMRPIWGFWVGVFLAPSHLIRKIIEIIGNFFKKSFSFLKKRITMLDTLPRNNTGEDRAYGEETFKTENTPQQ